MSEILRKSRVGRFVWIGLAVLSLLLFMVARQQEQVSLTKQVDEAQRRALLYANTVLYDALRAPTFSRPLTGAAYRDLYTDIQDQMFTDTRVARVRLWATDGTLLFSTNERDKIGEPRVERDPSIAAAAGGEVSSRLTTAPLTKATTGDPGTQTELFQTFVPLRVPGRIAVLGAVQIDQFYDSLRTAAAGPWKTAQAIFLALMALFAALAMLSFRRRPAVESTPADGSAAASSVEAAAAYAALEQRHEETLARLSSSEANANATTAELSGRADDLARRNQELEFAAARREAEEAAANALESRTIPTPSAQELELLEARLIAAEQRATQAERQLAELGHGETAAHANGHHPETSNGHHPETSNGHHPETSNGHLVDDHEDVTAGGESDHEPISPITAEATDLRARLARSAARKKRPASG